jgi:ATP-dependent DNA helicase RecG
LNNPSSQTEDQYPIRKRFPTREGAMLHGRMSPTDKEATMQRFKAGEINIFVSTTVIDVGIDVPNASIVLIMTSSVTMT